MSLSQTFERENGLTRRKPAPGNTFQFLKHYFKNTLNLGRK